MKVLRFEIGFGVGARKFEGFGLQSGLGNLRDPNRIGSARFSLNRHSDLA